MSEQSERRTRRGVIAASASALAALAGCSSLINHSGGGHKAQNPSGIAVRVKPTGDAVSALSALPVVVKQVGITTGNGTSGKLHAGNTVDLLANGGDPVEFFVLGFRSGQYRGLSLFGHAKTATKRSGGSAPASFAGGADSLSYSQDFTLKANETTVFDAAIAVTADGSGGYALAPDAKATSVSFRDGRPTSTTR